MAVQDCRYIGTDEHRTKLWVLCAKFIEDNDIECEETVYQTDRVAENALQLIEEIANIVGFVEYDE